MRFQGAIIREKGQTFAVVVVRQQVIANRNTAIDVITGLTPAFPGLPIVLMSQDNSGRPTYYGRREISKFLASVPVQMIPWREYTLN